MLFFFFLSRITCAFLPLPSVTHHRLPAIPHLKEAAPPSFSLSTPLYTFLILPSTASVCYICILLSSHSKVPVPLGSPALPSKGLLNTEQIASLLCWPPYCPSEDIKAPWFGVLKPFINHANQSFQLAHQPHYQPKLVISCTIP